MPIPVSTIVLVLAAALPRSEVGPRRGRRRRIPASRLTRRLADEVRAKGWIVYSARSRRGDWDLFACRPDGSENRNITDTAGFNEAAPQFSRDGQKLLYRRLPAGQSIDGNHYGAQGELVIASSDGTGPTVIGGRGEFPWASWSPDGEQIACLTIKGIAIVDLASRRTVRTLARKGFFQQFDVVARRAMALRRRELLRRELERGPHGARHRGGECRQRAGLLHAGLVPRRPGAHLLESAAGAIGEPGQRLDPALDGRPGRSEPPARLRRGRPSCLWRPRLAGRQVRGLHGQHAGGRRPREFGRADGPDAPGRRADHRRREPGAAQAVIPTRSMVPSWSFRPGGSRRWTAAEIAFEPSAAPAPSAKATTASGPARAPAGEAALAAELKTKGWIAFSALTEQRRLGPLRDASRRHRPERAHPDRGLSRGRRPVLARRQEDPLLPDAQDGGRRQQHVRDLRPRDRRCRRPERRGPRPRFPLGLVGARRDRSWPAWTGAASGSSTRPRRRNSAGCPARGSSSSSSGRPTGSRSRARPTAWARTGTSAG